MEIKAAIFDMDGTLIDSLMFWDVLWSAFGKRYLGEPAFRPNAEDDKKVRTLTMEGAMELIHRTYRFGESSEELLAITNEMIIDFYSNQVQPKHGVLEFLEHCRRAGVKMCVASATATELLEIALAHCGLDGYFQKLFSCAGIGKGKESPDIYLLAQEYLGTATAETWVFEDSLVAIRTAAKLGMPTVGIYDRYNFGQEEIKALANEYIAEGETLLKLI